MAGGSGVRALYAHSIAGKAGRGARSSTLLVLPAGAAAEGRSFAAQNLDAVLKLSKTLRQVPPAPCWSSIRVLTQHGPSLLCDPLPPPAHPLRPSCLSPARGRGDCRPALGTVRLQRGEKAANTVLGGPEQSWGAMGNAGGEVLSCAGGKWAMLRGPEMCWGGRGGGVLSNA